METELFLSIIHQLKQLNYSGQVALFSNNEPFLDSRISKFAEIARENLPDAYIHLYTNGSLLTLEKFLDIIKFLDRIIIDNYNDALELNEPVKIIYDYCIKNDSYKSKIEIHLRKINEVLLTRGGQSPNNNKKETLQIPCILPYKQIIVRPDGKISLCCNDALGKFTLGDLTQQSLIDIWNSDKYDVIRHKLRKSRAEISLCKFCDTFGGI
jgi:radical SAM protein with 4Fe4S-binding SPASM domain